MDPATLTPEGGVIAATHKGPPSGEGFATDIGERSDTYKGFGSPYNIRVGRSTSINSGYVDKTGKALTAGGGTLVATGNGSTFNGPGGQSVMFVGTKAYLVYHAYAPNSVVGGAATLPIADLVWDSSGWPVPVGP